MTQKAKTALERLLADQYELRDQVAARLAKMSPSECRQVLVEAGVLDKTGKLAALYRPRSAVA